ncbi:hypothetical protein H6F77_05525 [Microcoleus sp. FACHB-831]|uniref:hypothetical protein n=1 Tax=Microcoleus sp. FACHB-831 TaxID=2692827 RepID=UPI001682B458|nr:hypothetical protein [Microcoleus sp. FACHB-831]MBD1920547.1 hypothetical protein [Microcoleus sp. FACHB-831]
MSNELTQWLAEIRALKQQMTELERDRAAALAAEANWRQLYTTEAQQRRTEAKLAQQQIQTLKAQIRQLQDSPHASPDDPTAVQAIQQEIGQLQNIEQLKAKLTSVMFERDRLLDALKAEQASHAQTRKSLTTVIGDTIDKLARDKQK